MNQTPHQKNIIHGNITAGENIHIGDKITHIINQQKLEIPVRLTNFIPTDASHVVGRDDELAETHQKLRKNKPTVLVNGIGGIGKTTLAFKYIVTYAPQYQHVAWLNAAAGVQSAFIQDTALLDALHLRRDVEDCINAAQPDKAFDLVFKRLNDLALNTEGGKKILVVLDNANDFADLLVHKKYFDTAQIHFLITSRANPEGWQMVKVESLPKEQALELFKNIYPSVLATDEALDTVLSQLFYHTLLIELVAKAAKANAMVFDRLRQAINDKFIHDPALKKRKIDVASHSDAANETIKRATIEDYIWLIFENVHNLFDHAKDLLRAFTLLPPATSFDEDFLEKHFAQWNLTESMYDTLDLQLVESGWLERDYAADKPSYKMHPLIADVLIKHLDVQITFSEVYIMRVTEWIDYSTVIPEHDPLQKNKNKPLAERLSDLFSKENTEGTANLLDRLGYLELNFGFYNKAVEYRERALQIAETIFEENHGTIARLQNNLGWTYQYLGNYERAIELLESALESNIKNFGEGHPMVSLSQNRLGWTYSLLGNYNKAAALLEIALAIDLKNFGAEHPSVARSQSNLGAVYRKLGDHIQAAKLSETALSNALKTFGNKHPEVAKKQNNLAWVYYEIERFAEAKALWQLAYANYLRNFGAVHPDTVLFKKWADI